MKKNQQSAAKEHNAYFELDKQLNSSLPVYTASPCEQKCIKCDVSSKDCKYS